ncbi:MAG: arsenite methyltransferase [Syntrophomonadaceae bacterium]
MKDKEKIREYIKQNYTEVARQGSAGSCCSPGSGCCGGGTLIDIKDLALNLGYTPSDFEGVPIESNMGLGCGNPIAIAALKEGETVLDLGSGGGFDCFLAAKEVGASGLVIGVDMTPEMIRQARQNADKGDFKNVEFRLGEIEHLPVADNSVDAIVSNCVINLALDKQQVFHEMHRVLKPGGRISVSDIMATAEIPEEVKTDLKSITGCIAGAEQMDNVRAMLQKAGFAEISINPRPGSDEMIASWAPGKEKFVASFLIEAQKP